MKFAVVAFAIMIIVAALFCSKKIIKNTGIAEVNATEKFGYNSHVFSKFQDFDKFDSKNLAAKKVHKTLPIAFNSL